MGDVVFVRKLHVILYYWAWAQTEKQKLAKKDLVLDRSAWTHCTSQMEKPLCTCEHCCLCVKCCHLLGFIKRHSTSSRPHLTMPPRRKLSNFVRALLLHGSKMVLPSEKWPGVYRYPSRSLSDWFNATQPLWRSRNDADLVDRRRQTHVKIVSLNDKPCRQEQPLPASFEGTWGWLLTSTSASRPYGTGFMGLTSVPVAQLYGHA